MVGNRVFFTFFGISGFSPPGQKIDLSGCRATTKILPGPRKHFDMSSTKVTKIYGPGHKIAMQWRFISMHISTFHDRRKKCDGPRKFA